MNIVKLVQGSAEWHEHRRSHRNASETPAVLGVSPWTTPFQLWQIKTGRAPQPEVTAAMAHGTQSWSRRLGRPTSSSRAT